MARSDICEAREDGASHILSAHEGGSAELLTEAWSSACLASPGRLLAVCDHGCSEGAQNAGVSMFPKKLASRCIITPRLLFSLDLSVFDGNPFGLVPALQCSRPDLVETLKDSQGLGNQRAASGRTRSVLVVAEIALLGGVAVGGREPLTIRGFPKLQKYQLRFSIQPDRCSWWGCNCHPT